MCVHLAVMAVIVVALSPAQQDGKRAAVAAVPRQEPAKRQPSVGHEIVGVALKNLIDDLEREFGTNDRLERDLMLSANVQQDAIAVSVHLIRPLASDQVARTYEKKIPGLSLR
jgi:hypothetical protein